MLKWFHQNYLQANPENFQFMLMHKKQLCNAIKIGDVLLQPLESVKLLGVYIDRQLNFNVHITEMCKKAGRQLNVLGRLAKVLNTSDKMRLFECFIMSNCNYCPTIWHCCNISNMKKIEPYNLYMMIIFVLILNYVPKQISLCYMCTK